MTDKKTGLKHQLAQAREELTRLLASLTPDQWQTPVVGEGEVWTIRDTVAHLVENERGMSIHVHKIRKGQETVPAGFNLSQWNAGLKDRMGHPTPTELQQTLAQTRAKTLEVLDSIQEDEWSLTGRHPAQGVITVEQYYQTMADHDRSHTHDIKKALGLAA
jgi:hypothetical protein